MKAIMMSIRPEWVAKILNGEKTIEIRKKFPKDYVGWVYIYCTKDTKYKYGGLAYFGYGGNDCVHLNNDKMVDDFMDFKLGNLNDVSWTIQNDSKERVVARFWCDKVEEIINLNDDFGFDCVEVGYKTEEHSESELLEKSCLETLDDYLGNNNGIVGYAIPIANLSIFDKPREISEFKYYKKFGEIDYMLPVPRKETCERLVALTRAPESWQFIEI